MIVDPDLRVPGRELLELVPGLTGRKTEPGQQGERQGDERDQEAGPLDEASFIPGEQQNQDQPEQGREDDQGEKVIDKEGLVHTYLPAFSE